MKRQWWTMAVAAMLSCVAMIGLQAADKDGEGWISLFNGKDLSGWKKNEDGKFEVVDGTIKVSGKRAHLFTEKEFKNFEYKVECKTTKGSNSGLYFHTKFQEEGWPAQGYEAQVNVTHTDKIKTGSLYGVKNVEEVEVKDDEWYETYIKVSADTSSSRSTARPPSIGSNPKTSRTSPSPAARSAPVRSRFKHTIPTAWSISATSA